MAHQWDGLIVLQVCGVEKQGAGGREVFHGFCNAEVNGPPMATLGGPQGTICQVTGHE